MNRIKDILKEQGITINELAEKMGLNRVTLSTQIKIRFYNIDWGG